MSYTMGMIGEFGSTNTGLATVGYEILNLDGTVKDARTTTGVAEMASGSGIYRATVTIDDAFQGYIVWDNGLTGSLLRVASEPIRDVRVDGSEVVTGTAAGTLFASLVTTQQAQISVAKSALATLNIPLEIVQGDTLPATAFALQDSTGAPINLTGATVTYRSWEPEKTDLVLAGSVTITDAVNGLGQFNWAAGDTNGSADRNDAAKVVFADGHIQTFELSGVTIIPKNR